MNLKKSSTNKALFQFIFISNLFSEGLWVKYGFEIFDYIIDAPSVALGSANISYSTNSIASSIVLLIFSP